MCGNPLKKITRPIERAVSSVGKAIEQPFRTGASAAARSAEEQAQQQRREEDQRQQRIEQGKRQLDQIFGGLQGIGAQQRQAYMDFANPQLENQFGDARRDLAFALHRQGQGSGSLAGERFADLSRDFQLQQQEVADRARGYETQAQQNINDQRSALMSMLQSSADPGATSSQARQAVQTLSQRPAFSALGPLFQNVTGGLRAAQTGAQDAQIRRNTQGVVYGGDPDRATGRVLR